MGSSAEDNVKDTLINPFYAISLAEYLFTPQKLKLTKEDWVLANTTFIHDMGAEAWLKQLLVSLTTEPSDNLTKAVMNPREAVNFSKRLQGEHEPIVDVPAWVEANVKLMKELGTEQWLWQLLSVLETGGSTKL